MLAYIKGELSLIKDKYVIVINNNIGYKIFIGEISAHELLEQSPKEIELYLYHKVSDSAQELYGFTTYNKLNLFELLLSVSGVGPKTALAIVDGSPVADIMNAIANKDHATLSAFPGVGKKTAERIATDLADKVVITTSSQQYKTTTGHDLVDVLVSLGFKSQDARYVLSKIDPSITEENKIIKEALKLLSK